MMNSNNTIRIRTKYSLQMLLSILLLIVLLPISAKYTDLHDYSAYYTTYSTDHKMSIEVGYIALGNLFYSLGFKFYVFYAFIIGLSIIIIWHFFYVNSTHPFTLLLLFTIYPYINELQQIRSAFAAAIVLLGLSHLINENGNKLLFIPYVIIATTFHSTAITYLLFFFIEKISVERILKIAKLVLIFAVPVVLTIRLVIFKVFPLIPYFSMKYTKYLDEGIIIPKTFLLDWAIFFVVFLIILWATNRSLDLYSFKTNQLLKITCGIIMLTLLRGIGNNGYRIALMMYPVLYLTIDCLIKECSKHQNRTLLKAMLYSFPAICLIIWWGPLFPNMFDIVRFEMWKTWDYYY